MTKFDEKIAELKRYANPETCKAIDFIIQETNAAAQGFVAACGLLMCCVAMYFLLKVNEVHGNFPVTQVLYAVPISLASWVLCAVTDNPYGRYRTIWGFLGCNIFSTTMFTAAFILLSGEFTK